MGKEKAGGPRQRDCHLQRPGDRESTVSPEQCHGEGWGSDMKLWREALKGGKKVAAAALHWPACLSPMIRKQGRALGPGRGPVWAA